MVHQENIIYVKCLRMQYSMNQINIFRVQCFWRKLFTIEIYNSHIRFIKKATDELVVLIMLRVFHLLA